MSVFLADFITTELYKRSDAVAPIGFLGGNGKQIAILTQTPNLSQVSEDNLAVLVKIMARLGLSLDDLAVVNLKSTTTFEDLCMQIKPLKMLIFGQGIDFVKNIPFEQIVVYKAVTVLQTYDLGVISALAEQEKKITWAKIKDLLQ